MTKPSDAQKQLRSAALAYPGAVEDFPWGDRVVKVKGKIFVFLGRGEDGLSVTTKLPISGGMALQLPNTEPTGYGLGKSGWVSATFPASDDVPLPMLLDWIDESYRAVAPKKLVALLDGGTSAPAAAAPTATPKVATAAKPKAAKAATPKAPRPRAATPKAARPKAARPQAAARSAKRAKKR